MKSLLFIMNNLNTGGAEKALVSLFQTIDYSKYSVDLLLFKQEGAFLKQVPKEVNLLPSPKNYTYFDMSIKKAVIENILKLDFKVVFNRIMAGYIFKTESNAAVREQRVWKYLKHTLSEVNKNYDVAIGYLEKTPNYFCVDKVQAKKKIGFIHNDYNKLKMSSKIDEPYFNKLDYIVTVSEGCKLSLIKTFPKLKNRFKVMFNISSQKNIWSLASKENNNLFKEGVNLLTVGRLNSQKGYDNGVEACKILVDKGIDVNWYVLGEGEERGKLEKLIQKNNLEERFILLGNKENPYPYILNSDIYVQPSKFEGKSIAIDEAKILQKPIVVTNFSTAKDQINDGVNGLIADMNPQSIADSIEMLMNDKILKNSFIENLSNEQVSTENEIYKFYKIIEY